MTSKPLPDVTDPEFAGFYESCRKHQLVVQACHNCGRRRWPPRPVCPTCQTVDSSWTAVANKGTLYSWIVVWRPGVPGFEREIPYTVAVVEVDHETPIRFLGNVIGADPSALYIGQPMVTAFVEVADGVTLPYWRAAMPDAT